MLTLTNRLPTRNQTMMRKIMKTLKSKRLPKIPLYHQRYASACLKRKIFVNENGDNLCVSQVTITPTVGVVETTTPDRSSSSSGGISAVGGAATTIYTSQPTTILTTTQPATTTTTTTPVPTTTEYIEPENINNAPMIKARLVKLAVTAGKPFNHIVPLETFYDTEDGTNLKLELLDKFERPLEAKSWIQFNAETRNIYGL